MRLYLAGPMTGIPRFNFPAFDRWACALRSVGFDVLSPHEADPYETRAIAWRSADGDPAALPESDGPIVTTLRNVEGVGTCHGLALMPDWQRSAGTRHEIATADRFGVIVAPAGMWLHLGPELAWHATGNRPLDAPYTP